MDKTTLNYVVQKNLTTSTIYIGDRDNSHIIIYNAQLRINRNKNDPRRIRRTHELTRIESRLKKKLNLNPVDLITLQNPFKAIHVFSPLQDGIDISDLDYQLYTLMVALKNGAPLSDLLYGAIRPKDDKLKARILSTLREKVPANFWNPTELWNNRHRAMTLLYRLFELQDHPAYSDIKWWRIRDNTSTRYLFNHDRLTI